MAKFVEYAYWNRYLFQFVTISCNLQEIGGEFKPQIPIKYGRCSVRTSAVVVAVVFGDDVIDR